MIKAVFIAEDDDYLGLKTHDVIYVDPLKNGDGYIYKDKFGVKLFIERWEVEEISYD